MAKPAGADLLGLNATPRRPHFGRSSSCDFFQFRQQSPGPILPATQNVVLRPVLVHGSPCLPAPHCLGAGVSWCKGPTARNSRRRWPYYSTFSMARFEAGQRRGQAEFALRSVSPET